MKKLRGMSLVTPGALWALLLGKQLPRMVSRVIRDTCLGPKALHPQVLPSHPQLANFSNAKSGCRREETESHA